MEEEAQQQLLCFNLILNAAIICVSLLCGGTSRRWWVRPINRDRAAQGHYNNLFRYMKMNDHEEFFEYTRMSPSQFDLLVELVTPFLISRSIRKPLPIELKVALTLSYLAHGGAIRTQSWNFRIGRSTAYKVIPQVCEAIWKALQPTYLPSMTNDKWKTVAKDFFELWQFPNCVGSIDGKHIKIQAPPLSGSQYYNYKSFFSLVLMAACDARYRFTWVDIGQYGSISDSGVFSRTDFGASLEKERVDLPPPRKLPMSDMKTSHAFVGDEAFPLKMNILRPYSRKELGDAERIFNYRLSRARRVIENTFGILASRWQILRGTISCHPENAIPIVQALVCLHNFIMTNENEIAPNARLYCPEALIDHDDEEHNQIDGQWREQGGENIFGNIGRLGANNSSRKAALQRDTLKEYFTSQIGEAQAPWQYACAFRGLF